MTKPWKGTVGWYRNVQIRNREYLFHLSSNGWEPFNMKVTKMRDREILQRDDRDYEKIIQSFCRRYGEAIYVGGGNQYGVIAPIGSIGYKLAKKYNVRAKQGAYCSAPKGYVFIGSSLFNQ